MARIEAQEPRIAQLAKRTLSWIRYEFKYDQLNIMQLRHALSVQPGMKAITSDDLVSEEDILSSCLGLVNLSRARKDGLLYTSFSRTSRRYL